ncbi:ATP-binding cassette domain-containing protein [Streptomyces sp. NPDC048277]|uniref:ABC transporter ATP-binding protein n=1 Tax=Streptomyces sp. NPDC048277 TaxID=3155027 RepID=UPI0033EDD871
MSHPPRNTDADSEDTVAAALGFGVVAADGRKLLEATSLSLRPGRVVAVTGPSGTGKTTLLRAFLGHLPHGTVRSGGTVHVLGHDMFAVDDTERREIRRDGIAYVGQDPASSLNPRLRIRTLLSELSADASPDAVVELLDAVRLPSDRDFAARRPGQLSGGQLRRVALARALSKRPRLLLLDEPTAGLDPVLRDEITELLRTLALGRRLALGLSSHDRDVIARLADDAVDLTAVGVRPPRTPRPAGDRSVTSVTPVRPPHTAASARPVLEVRDLSVVFPGRGAGQPGLTDVRFAVAEGAAAAVIGASGSGKTTLARALVGLRKPRSGTIRFDGADLRATVRRRSREQRRRIQLITQDPLGALNPSRTVGSTVARPLRIHGRASSGAVAGSVQDLLELVGLPRSFASRYPHELSGGQRQRVAIARALAAEPDILICDEITSALDPATGAAVMDLLHRLRQDRSLTLVVISHDLTLVRERTDTITVLASGRVVESGNTADVFAAPQHTATRELLSASLAAT